MNSKKKELLNKLDEANKELQIQCITLIKEYEIEFQKVIEEIYPEKEWWETTECQIFNHLLEFKDPQKTIIEIVKQLKPEYK